MSTPGKYYDWNNRGHGEHLNNGDYEHVGYDYYGGDELHLANIVFKDSAYVTYDNTHVRLLNKSDINLFDTSNVKIYDSGTLTISTSSAPDSRTFIVDSTGKVGIGMLHTQPLSSAGELPQFDLHVKGNVGVEDYIYHNNDTDTYILFGDDETSHYVNTTGAPDLSATTDYDEINIRVGGVDMLQMQTRDLSAITTDQDGLTALDVTTQDFIAINKRQSDVDLVARTTTNSNAFVIRGDGSEVVFNEDGNDDTDFRIESNNSKKMFFVDTSQDYVEIRGADGDDSLILDVLGNSNTGSAGASLLRVSPTEVVVNESSNNVNFRVEADTTDPTQNITDIGTDGGIQTHLPHDPSAALYVDGVNGRVGLGISNPDTTLHIAGSAHIEGDLWVKGHTNQIDTLVYVTSAMEITNKGTGPALSVTQTGSQPVLTVKDDNVTAFHIEDGGNVGINTANPDRLLDISFSIDNSGEVDYRDIEGVRIINLNTTPGTKSGINFATPGSSIGIVGERISGDDMRMVMFGESNDGNPTPIMSMLASNRHVGIGTNNPGPFHGNTFTPVFDVHAHAAFRSGSVQIGGGTYRKASLTTPTGAADEPYFNISLATGVNTSTTAAKWRYTNTGLHSMDMNNYITLYGNQDENHGIGSRSTIGSNSDDIRINTYGSLIVNLDSNTNNSSGADYIVGKHGGLGTISADNTMFRINGETGQVTIRGTATNDFVAIRTTLGGAANSTKYYTEWEAAGGFKVVREKSTSGNLDIGIDSNDSSQFTHVGGHIVFKTNKSGTYGERVRIHRDGRVGINTNDPDSYLSIANIGANDDVKLLGFGEGAGDGVYFKSKFTPNNEDNAIVLASSYSDQIMTWEMGGNVGIGTNTPRAKLSIPTNSSGASSADGIGLGNDANTYGFNLWHDNSNATLTYFDSVYNSADSAMVFRLRTSGTATEALKLKGNNDAIFGNALHVPNYIYHRDDTNTYMQFGADTWTLRTGGTDRISVNNSRTYIPGYVRIDGGMEIATNEDNDSPELTFKRTSATNAGGTDDIGHIRIGDGSMNFILNNDSDGDQGTFNFRKVVGGSEVGALINTATVQATTVEIGNKVSLAESSDRADLLQITGTTSGYAGLQIRNSSNEGRWSYMTDGSGAGLYDDENNKWSVHMTEKAAVKLYYNGSNKISTTDTGVTITGDIDSVTDIYVADQIIHSGDTNTYMQFHAADQWRVVTGNVERFEVNNSTSSFQTDVLVDGGHQLYVGEGDDNTRLHIKKADNDTADHLIFYNGTTRIGEIGCLDDTWLRINNTTAKNIYTPRYIRADSGFFVDDTTKGIDGSGNFIGGTIAGASDYGTLLRSDANDSYTGSGVLTLESTAARQLTIAGTNNEKIALKAAANGSPYIRFVEGTTDKAYVQWNAGGYVYIRNQEDASGLRIRDSIDFTKDGTTFYDIWHEGNDGDFVKTNRDSLVAADIVLDKTATATSSNGGTDSHSLIFRAQNYDTSGSTFASSPGGAKNFDWRVTARAYGGTETWSELQFFADHQNNANEIPLTLHGGGDNTYYVSPKSATFKGTINVEEAKTGQAANIILQQSGSYLQGGLRVRDSDDVYFGSGFDARIYYDGTNDILYHDNQHETVFRNRNSSSFGSSYHEMMRFRYTTYPYVSLFYDNDEKFITHPAGIKVKTTRANTTGSLEGSQIDLQCFDTGVSGGLSEMAMAIDTYKDPYGIYGHQDTRKTTDNTNADLDWLLRFFNATTGDIGLHLHTDTGAAIATKFRSRDSWSNFAPQINGTATYMPWSGPSQTDYDSSQGYRYTEIANGSGWGAIEMKNDLGGLWDVGSPGSDMHGRIAYLHHGLGGGDDWAGASLDNGRWEFHVGYKQPARDTNSRYDATTLNGGSSNYGDDTLQMTIQKDVVLFTGDIVPFYSFSDARLKEEITTIDSQEALDKVLQLNGVTFKWKDDRKRGTQMGMVAQQVAEVVPEVIDEQSRIGDENTYMRVDYEKIVPLLVEGMKQQQKQIELLQQQIEHLTNNNK